MNFKLKTINYIFFDFLSSALAWTIFNYYRKTQIDILKTGLYSGEVFDRQYFFSVLTLPLIWVLVYYLSGSYNNVLRKSRINEFVQILSTTILGVTVLFFVLLLDDSVVTYKLYYKLYFVLFSAHFFITSIFRIILSTEVISRKMYYFWPTSKKNKKNSENLKKILY